MYWKEVSVIDLEAQISPEILARGRDYYHSGHLLRACMLGEILAGEVAGAGGNYRVRLWLEENRIAGDCTCPYPGFCKHMAALVLAWVEDSKQFIDLQPHLKQAASNADEIRILIERLIQKDPINFLSLIQSGTAGEDFLTSRGILNLIRNTFSGKFLTHLGSQALWERIKRVQELIADAVTRKEEAAPELLHELLAGVACAYREYPDSLLEESFKELLTIAGGLPGVWKEEQIRPLADLLLEFCLDPKLWQIAVSVRPVLILFHRKLPGWLVGKLESRDWKALNQVELIAYYELLKFMTDEDSLGGESYLERIAEILSATAEGRLWLIDRLSESDLELAYVWAKEGMRSGGEMKRAFRERLISIHLKRGENKQAASLSFIQFQEEPNFEEYLRLKHILAQHPKECRNYLSKMEQVIAKPELAGIAAQIAFDQKDWLKLEAKLNRINPGDASLNELARAVNNSGAELPSGVYQALIARLLKDERSNWEVVLRIMAQYKKICRNNFRNREWEEFRVRLNGEYGEDRRFARKFGAILAE